MYEEINNTLESLQQGIYRCRKIDTMLKSLSEQLNEQERKQRMLEDELNKEKLDVEKLSKMSIASVFYTILGSREMQLEKERQELLAAQLRIDDIKRQIAETKRLISQLQSERMNVSNSESKYNELVQKKRQMLKDDGSQNASQIIELENKISAYKANIKEISEAISAGNSAMNSLDRVKKSLDSAEGWGMWDMWGGGGLITNLVKHDHIDDARDAASDVQMLLNRFRTELADVKVSSSIAIEIEGFAKFADFFFDGLIADWVVQSKIHDSQDSVSHVRSEVSSVLYKLSQMLDRDKGQLRILEKKLSQIIAGA